MESGKNKKNGKVIVLIIGAVLGLVMLSIGFFADNEAKTSEETENGYLREPSMSADEYAAEVESRIARLCSGVMGVSNVKVAVTLSGGYNAVYAQDSQSGASGYKNEFVLVGSGSSERALLIGYSLPQISGVGIVCSGGGDSKIRQELISLVSATYGVSSNKIYVTEGQK